MGNAPNHQRVGLIGYPLGHSLSPVFQQAAFDALGIPAHYELWPTSPEDVPAVIAGLRQPGMLGCNITVPHKEAVLPLVDEVAPSAARLGAANTIVRLPDSRLRADNTDLHGFSQSLAEAELALDGATVVVIGAGGAARAVLVALATLGVARIVVANRNLARAARLIDELALDERATPVPLDGTRLEPLLAGAALLVNATAVGWHGDETPIDPAVLPPAIAVYDLTYRSTALLRAARARGLVTIDGLRMLVYQGARAFELWTGQPAPAAIMLTAAEAALAARERGA